MCKSGIPSCSWNAVAGWKSHKAARNKQHQGGSLVTGEELRDGMRNILSENELNKTNQIFIKFTLTKAYLRESCLRAQV